MPGTEFHGSNPPASEYLAGDPPYSLSHRLQDSIIGCIEVGIALAIDSCNNGVCPQPQDQLGSVLYAGPFTPTGHGSGGFYQNFTLQVPDYMTPGPAIFTLTHLCLIGVCSFLLAFRRAETQLGSSQAGPAPLLEYRNTSVTID